MGSQHHQPGEKTPQVYRMELYKEMEGRLFTASVPNLDLSTILFVVIVEAAFLAGLIARDHLSYLFLQPVHSYAATVGNSYNNHNHHQQNHNHGRGGEIVGSL